MIKKFLTCSCFIILGFSAFSQTSEKQFYTAADYERAVKFLGFNIYNLADRASVRPTWLDDDRFWYEVSTNGEKELVLIDPAPKSRKTASLREELLKDIESSSPSPERRYSRTEVLSPDGKKAVFIRDWNLWMKDVATGEETRLTTDGTENFGYATDNAGWRKRDRPIVLWSPDSKKIATYQQDQRHVSDMYLVSTNVGEPKLEDWKYPLPADEDIIRIQRVIIEVDSPNVVRLKMPADPRRGTLCDDISCSGAFDDNQWNEDASKLMFVSTSRDQL